MERFEDFVVSETKKHWKNFGNSSRGRLASSVVLKPSPGYRWTPTLEWTCSCEISCRKSKIFCCKSDSKIAISQRVLEVRPWNLDESWMRYSTWIPSEGLVGNFLCAEKLRRDWNLSKKFEKWLVWKFDGLTGVSRSIFGVRAWDLNWSYSM